MIGIEKINYIDSKITLKPYNIRFSTMEDLLLLLLLFNFIKILGFNYIDIMKKNIYIDR